MIWDVIIERNSTTSTSVCAASSALTVYTDIKLSLWVSLNIYFKPLTKGACIPSDMDHFVLSPPLSFSKFVVLLCVRESESISLGLPVGVFPLQVCVSVHTGTLVCVWARVCVCESDSKASVSSHVHYTHSLWQHKGKKKGSLWHTLLEVSPGGVSWDTHTSPKNTCAQTYTETQTHTESCSHPQPALLWWCDGDVAAWGAPLESGTDGRKETTHWSWLTTFLLSFFLSVVLIKCQDMYVLVAYLFMHSYVRMCLCVCVCVHAHTY